MGGEKRKKKKGGEERKKKRGREKTESNRPSLARPRPRLHPHPPGTARLKSPGWSRNGVGITEPRPEGPREEPGAEPGAVRQ